jgi:hypothetical protein
MGHKFLLPVDVVLKTLKFSPFPDGTIQRKFAQFSGICSRPGVEKNSFSIYHANTVGLTVSGGNLNAYNV